MWTSHYSCPPFAFLALFDSLEWIPPWIQLGLHSVNLTAIDWTKNERNGKQSGMLQVVVLCLSKSSLGVANGDKRERMVDLVGRRVWTMTVPEETTMVVNECGSDGYSNCLY